MPGCQNASDVRDCSEDGVEYQSQDKSAGALNEVCGNAGGRACTVQEIFKAEISAGHQNHVQNASGCNARIGMFSGMGKFLIGKSGGHGHQSLYEQSNGYISQVSAQKVGHAGTNAGSQESIERAKNHTGENDNGVSRVNVSACSRGDPDKMVATQQRAAKRAVKTRVFV